MERGEELDPEPSPPPPKPQAIPRLWNSADGVQPKGMHDGLTVRPGSDGYASEGEDRSERSYRSVSSTAELDSYLKKYDGGSSDEENRGQGRRQRRRACPLRPTPFAGKRQPAMALTGVTQPADGMRKQQQDVRKQKQEHPRGIACEQRSHSVGFSQPRLALLCEKPDLVIDVLTRHAGCQRRRVPLKSGPILHNSRYSGGASLADTQRDDAINFISFRPAVI